MIFKPWRTRRERKKVIKVGVMRRDPNFKEENTLKHRPFEALAQVSSFKAAEPRNRKGPVHELELAQGHEVLVLVDRAPKPSDTVKVTRNADGEFVRADYYNDAGELVATEEAVPVKFAPVIQLIEPPAGSMQEFDDLAEQANRARNELLLGAGYLAPKDCKP